MGLISTGPGSPLAFSAASGGKVYAFNAVLTATTIIVAPANSARQKIVFHNPGVNDIFICPSVSQNNESAQTFGSNNALNPNASALGGCFRVYANGGTLVIEGECQGIWRAFASIGTTNPLTVMDSNV